MSRWQSLPWNALVVNGHEWICLFFSAHQHYSFGIICLAPLHKQTCNILLASQHCRGTYVLGSMWRHYKWHVASLNQDTQPCTRMRTLLCKLWMQYEASLLNGEALGHSSQQWLGLLVCPTRSRLCVLYLAIAHWRHRRCGPSIVRACESCGGGVEKEGLACRSTRRENVCCQCTARPSLLVALLRIAIHRSGTKRLYSAST